MTCFWFASFVVVILFRWEHNYFCGAGFFPCSHVRSFFHLTLINFLQARRVDLHRLNLSWQTEQCSSNTEHFHVNILAILGSSALVVPLPLCSLFCGFSNICLYLHPVCERGEERMTIRQREILLCSYVCTKVKNTGSDLVKGLRLTKYLNQGREKEVWTQKWQQRNM